EALERRGLVRRVRARRERVGRRERLGRDAARPAGDARDRARARVAARRGDLLGLGAVVAVRVGEAADDEPLRGERLAVGADLVALLRGRLLGEERVVDGVAADLAARRLQRERLRRGEAPGPVEEARDDE